MPPEAENRDLKRRETLRNVLTRLRDEIYMKVNELRRVQEEEAQPPPADDLEAARATEDVETHASLIEQAQDKLRFIDEALERVERGTYGTCAECRRDIPVERLTAVPFALYCVDCQEKQNHARRRWGEGSMISPYDHQWTLPEEMRELREYKIRMRETRPTIHYEGPPRPEKTEPGKITVAKPRAGRREENRARRRPK